jgi:hypothetical protein
MDVTSRAQGMITQAAGLEGHGLVAAGAGIQRVGQALDNYADRRAFDSEVERKKQSTIALNDAKTTWLLNASNLEQSLDGERDPAEISKNYIDAYNKAAEASRQYLTDEQRQDFDAWVTPHLIGGHTGVNKRIAALEADHGRARSATAIETFRNKALREPTAAGAMSQIPNIARELDNGVLKGYWPELHAAEQKNALTRQVATDWIKAQPDDVVLSVLRPANVNEAAKHGVDFFQKRGWEPHQASAIMGHFLHESGGNLDPNAVNPGDGRDGSDSIGIGQWNGDRAKALKAFAASQGKPWNDLDVQLQFAQREFDTNEKAAADAIRASKTVDEAISAGLKYERPKGYEGGIHTAAGGSQRLRYGRAIYSQLHEGSPAPDTRISQLMRADDAKQIADAAEHREAQRRAQEFAAEREAIATRRAVDLVNSGAGINAFDADGKKDLDRAFAGLVQGGMPERDALTHIVDQAKAVPPDAVQGIRQGLSSNDPNAVVTSATAALNLMSRGGNAIFAPHKGGDEISKEATKFEHYSDYLSPQDAAKRVIAERDPSYQARVKAQRDTNGLEKNLSDDEKAGTLLDDIAKHYGTPRFGGWLGTSAASVAFREGDRQQLVEDYKDRIRQNYDVSSDYALARKQAQKDLSHVWGQSNVTGKPVAMRYPPENAPAFTGIPDVADNFAAQVQEAIKAERGVDIDRSKIILDPIEDGSTMRAYRSNQSPPYRVSWIDKDGHLQMLNPGYAFVADVEKMHKATEEKFRAKQALLSETPPESVALGDATAIFPESVVR